jgi:hypothetical protein
MKKRKMQVIPLKTASPQVIREAIGAGPDDEIHIMTPQFERPAGLPEPGAPPVDMVAFVAEVPRMSPEMLRKAGLGAWGCPEDAEGNEIHDQGMLWLLPGEWYPHLPAGLKITTISFEEETFVPGKTDDDIRFGCLAYGVMGPELLVSGISGRQS